MVTIMGQSWENLPASLWYPTLYAKEVQNMAEKKPSDSAQKLIAAMKEYRAKVERMSPEERAAHEKKKQALAKWMGLSGKRVIDEDEEYLLKNS